MQGQQRGAQERRREGEKEGRGKRERVKGRKRKWSLGLYRGLGGTVDSRGMKRKEACYGGRM
jgi:hypothetical protein